MVNVYDVHATDLIEAVAKKLAAIPEMKAPSWAPLVKTGVDKMRPPVRKDWWFVRSAAILRVVYLRGPIGVSKLRRNFGGRKNRGVAPDKTYPGSGSIIRHSLQGLEKAGLIKKAEKDSHKGRVITPKGMALLDKTAGEVLKTDKKAAANETKPKKEEKPAQNKENAPKQAPKPEEKAQESPKKEKAAEPKPEPADKE